jgi:chromosome segregation ATPase
MSDKRIRELENQIQEAENRIAEQQWIIGDYEDRTNQARDEIQIQQDIILRLGVELCAEPFDEPV